MMFHLLLIYEIFFFIIIKIAFSLMQEGHLCSLILSIIQQTPLSYVQYNLYMLLKLLKPLISLGRLRLQTIRDFNYLSSNKS